MLFLRRCPKHGFRYISMPRCDNEADNSTRYIAKCPLSGCLHGIHKDDLCNCDPPGFIPCGDCGAGL